MSSFIPPEFIAELLTRTDIVELIDARVPLKKAGRNYHACCPFHSEKTPSFTVSPHKQFYHCFGCGVSGNAIGFLMNYEHLEFLEAVEVLAKPLGIEVPYRLTANQKYEKSENLYDVLEKAQQFYQKQLRSSPKAIQYLQQRGITGETAKHYAIGFAPPAWDSLYLKIHQPVELLKAGLIVEGDKKEYHDRFRHRIMFPIRDRRGRVIGFGGRVLGDRLPKYLNSPETPVFHKSRVLYGLYEAREKNASLEQLVVVEGYMDVIALAQVGITYTVATLGTAITSLHVQQLFQQTSKVIFCFDGDKAGETAAWRALEATLPILQDNTQAHFLFLPQGEDPDSFVKKVGVEKFLVAIAEAVPLADFFFKQLKQGINLKTLEGRAQLAHQALPKIEKLTAPFMQEMMLEKLAEITRVERSRLQQFSAPTPEKIVETPNAGVGGLQKTPMRLAIALLLQNSKLMDHLVIDITLLTLPGSELLKAIYWRLKENPHLNTACLLEYWRDHASSAVLYKLAIWEHGVPEAGVIAEWKGIQQHLYKQQRQYHIEMLLQKASRSVLTDRERKQLQDLFKENMKE